MGEVLRALEGPIAPMICVTDDPNHLTCERSGHCTVNFMWVGCATPSPARSTR
jgi:DNA-binding IscR family transcriptional regulator